MRTYSPKPDDITREWFVIDATDVVLGRLATAIASASAASVMIRQVCDFDAESAEAAEKPEE